jgi:hypothetical protein
MSKLKCNVKQCENNKNNKCLLEEVEINLCQDEYEYAYCNKYKESLDSLRENYWLIKNNNMEICEHNYIIFSNNVDTMPSNCFESIIEDLINDKNVGKVKVLIDNLLARGNSEDERYIEFVIDCDKKDIASNSFGSDTFRFYKEHKNNELRKFCAGFYKNYPEYIESSILTSVQKRMILKGLGI